MTFQEIEQSLPNGFHDARLLQASLDIVGRCATVKLSVHISVEADSDRERYRVGILNATKVALYFIEPPDANYKFILNGEGIGVSGDTVALEQEPELRSLLSKLPPDIAAYRFFLKDWNSFFYIAAGEATFVWEQD
jgi:hypothetical protein